MTLLVKQKLLRLSGGLLMLVLVTLVVWQGSFNFGEYGPRSPEQTYLFWAVSTLVFLLTVLLGFMLFRTALKLYIERQAGKEGSRIKLKLVAGALALSFIPVIFLVVFDINVLNRNLDKWFSRPAQNIKIAMQDVRASLERETRDRVAAQAEWLALLPSVRQFAESGGSIPEELRRVCEDQKIDTVLLERPDGGLAAICGGNQPAIASFEAQAKVALGDGRTASLRIRDRIPVDLAQIQMEIERQIRDYDQLARNKKEFRRFYLALLVLISLFLLFVATWLALFFARQISVPITALLEAVQRLRSGDLDTRVRVKAIDELAVLVRGFNEMAKVLEANSAELERRRRFTEAILESIPTGVISLASDGRIQRVNKALNRMFPPDHVANAKTLDALFSKEDATEIRYLMKRARRIGLASRQFEIRNGQQILHISVTISALEEKETSGFVMVMEDTSELLRAQKSVAWNEVARRIAHEIKNPLTPIALSADRIARQLERGKSTPEFERIARHCTEIILREVESVKTLVDEFSQFSRFPAAKPEAGDLNQVVNEALAVFHGRLDGIELRTELDAELPPVNIDRELIKRVVVNLVDNAAEAMQDTPVKRLFVGTQAPTSETVELVVADTGCGVSMEDKEKLFLPYFSTKGRGTGLGLAIVNHILSDHNAHIRVEDNIPAGARFIVEFPATAPADAELNPAESRA